MSGGENTVQTRSKTQGSRKDNMAEFPNKEKTTKGEKNNLDSNSEAEEFSLNSVTFKDQTGGVDATALNELFLKELKASNEQHDTNQHVLKGYVADRVEQINSNPSTPVATNKMPKAKSSIKAAMKSSTKTRVLVAKDGQLGLQSSTASMSSKSVAVKSTETSGDMTLHNSRQQHDSRSNDDSDTETSDLTTVLKELHCTVKKLEKKLDQINLSKESTEEKVSTIEAIQQQDAVKLHNMVEQIEDHDDKIDALIGIVVRQDQQIQSLTNQINSSYAARNFKNVVINGIPETQGENCFHEVAHFIKHILKVDKVIPIKYARRLGKGQSKPMMIRLQNASDKPIFFQNFDKVKIANVSRDRPYFITDQLPEAWAERKRFIQHLKKQNSKLPVDQRKKVEVKNGEVFFDDVKYKPPLAPTLKQFLRLSAERRQTIRHLPIIKGEQQDKLDSIFIGYAAETFSVKQVEDYYFLVKLLEPEATHIMCGF